VHPGAMKAKIGGKRYDTEKAALIAHGKYWHGHNTFLYRTPKGDYFIVRLTLRQGEQDILDQVSQEEARKLWESLPEHEVEFEEGFPQVKIEEE
jgi:hypothetical protein